MLPRVMICVVLLLDWLDMDEGSDKVFCKYKKLTPQQVKDMLHNPGLYKRNSKKGKCQLVILRYVSNSW